MFYNSCVLARGFKTRSNKFHKISYKIDLKFFLSHDNSKNFQNIMQCEICENAAKKLFWNVVYMTTWSW